MPNGGPDNCGNCRHNKAVQEIQKLQKMGQTLTQDDIARLRWEKSHCTLRDVKITRPMWTYCENVFLNTGKLPLGWIYASGLYEGYVRIPWDDKNEPRGAEHATCVICHRTTPGGLEIDHDGRILGFCTNQHYVKWWKTIHQDESIDPEKFESPTWKPSP